MAIPGTCLPFAPVNYIISSTNIFLDIFIFMLPIPIFLSTSINKRLKMELSFLFALGLLVTVCSIVKITYVPQIARGVDPTPFVILSSLEINVGVCEVPSNQQKALLTFLRASSAACHISDPWSYTANDS